MKRTVQVFAALIDIIIVITFVFMFYLEGHLPDNFSVVSGEKIHLPYPVELSERQTLAVQADITAGGSYEAELRLLGAIPVKTVQIRVVDRKTVRVSGAPFGIKMFTDGLMIVGMSDVAGEGARLNPAKLAGLKVGDIVEKIGGVRLTSNEQLDGMVQKSEGGAVRLGVRRGTEKLELSVKPVRSLGDGKYRLGIWVRDSSAGIGTLTYYDPNSGVFTGLGHAVCDIDTGDIMPLQSGEIVSAEITGCKIGKAGTPGELKGRFSGRGSIGELVGNTTSGVFGYLRGNIYMGREVTVATANEVKTGEATILTTIEGSEPQEYSVEIEKAEVHENGRGQNMIIRVTDPRLLEKTGGIVQGMSGSPILQEGMLVGSVTHVFVNDPMRGFGIFAENIDNTYKLLSNAVETA
ncbi:MAG: SpoIVB peptidase, partial [Angelakisella sp.]